MLVLWPFRAFAIHDELRELRNSLAELVATLKTIKTTSADAPQENNTITFADLPQELKVVAQCESGLWHEKYGKIMKSKTGDIGLFQISPRHHQKQAELLGYDIYTFEGNMTYAYWLWQREGLKPWLPSRNCWSKKIARN